MLFNDQFVGECFYYCLFNLFFGKKWEKDKIVVEVEYKKGELGWFGLGLLKISDGFMLFLMYLVSKLELLINGGGCVVIVLFGLLLFNGGVVFGELEICCWLLEDDLIEVIVVLLMDLFFCINIVIYLWILFNKKFQECKGKVQLINVIDLWILICNEGNKCCIVSDEQCCQILDIYVVGEIGVFFWMLDYCIFGYCCIRVLCLLCMILELDKVGMEWLEVEVVWEKFFDVYQIFWCEVFKLLIG